MIEKEGYWVNYELKQRDVGRRRLFACEQLLERQRGKGFLHCIVTGNEKWVYYNSRKCAQKIMGIVRWSYCYVNTSAAEYPWLKSHALRLVGGPAWRSGYCELLKPSELNTGERYRRLLMRRSRTLKGKWTQYNERHDMVTLQYDNVRPHFVKLVVKKYLETLKWANLPHPPYSPDVATSHFHLSHLAQWHTAWLTSTSARMKK
nr:transposase [Hymenolepis microstoma]